MSHHDRNKPSCTAANTTSTFRSPRWETFRILFCTAEQVREEGLGGWAGQREQEALDKGPCWWQFMNSQLRTDPSQVWKTHIPTWLKPSSACCPHSTSLSAWPVSLRSTAAQDLAAFPGGKAEVSALGMLCWLHAAARSQGRGETQFLLIARVLLCVITLGKLLPCS